MDHTTSFVSIASQRDLLSSICSFLTLGEVVRVLTITRKDPPTIFPTQKLLLQLGRKAVNKTFTTTRFLDSLVFDKVASLKQLRGLFYFLKSIPTECLKKRKNLTLCGEDLATFHGVTKVAERSQLSLPYKLCTGKSCQKVVFWECPVCCSVCDSCNMHCGKCYDCNEKICIECGFDSGLCFACGFMCEGCEDIFSLNNTCCYECTGKYNQPCVSNLGPRCVDCSFDIHICGECSETYCDACEQVNFCDLCQDWFCAGCKEVAECSSCTRIACLSCDPTFFCEMCEEFFCTTCKRDVHDA